MNWQRIKTWTKQTLRLGLLAVFLFAATVAVCWLAFPFPIEKLDAWPRSPIVTDRHGQVMLDLVGSDDQWRLPIELHDMSPWLLKATVAVEDERFYTHVGVDPIAIGRAVGQNVSNGRVVSGASTITMQVCRMMDDRPRTLWSKAVESFRALQLEQIKSKDEILEIYLNLAPYGGNLRGVEAASQAYFGKPARHLSLGEAALLAGLPQSPERYRPDRFPEHAGARRDTVLARMVEAELITQADADEAAALPLVFRTRSRERTPIAMHAAWMALNRCSRGGCTTIDFDLQQRIASLATDHVKALPEKTNAAVVVIDVQQAELLAVVGSVRHGDGISGQVNGGIAPRSPGSALKPFVFAAAMDAGRLNRDTVLFDGAIERDGWSPSNFDRRFRGNVRAEVALQQSLNVPAILVAEGTGLHRCVGVMRSAGVELPDNTMQRGGLAVVVGSIETNLLSLTNAYATLARRGVRRNVRLFLDEVAERSATAEQVIASNVCASLDDMLSSDARRPRGMELKPRDEVPWFMWKTGTSSGRRDAWAVGHNGRFAIGVWIGRFDGSGDASYVGREAAEPLLAALFDEPALRRIDRPQPTGALAVRRPLPMPAEQRTALRITSPADGTVFIATDHAAPIRFASNQSNVIWFLNGKRLAPDELTGDELGANRFRANQLAPIAGRYQLVCTNPQGESSSIHFQVK